MSIFSHSISCFNSLPHMLSFFLHLLIHQDCSSFYLAMRHYLFSPIRVCCHLFTHMFLFAGLFRTNVSFFFLLLYLRLLGLPRYFMIVYILYHSHFPLTHTQIHCSPPFHPHPHSIILLFSFPFFLFYFTSLRSLLRECKFFFFFFERDENNSRKDKKLLVYFLLF